MHPPFLVVEAKMGSIVCILLVHDCIRVLLFVHHLRFYLSLGKLGTCYPPFLILDSKMDSTVCISFVHDCIQLFSFVHLILFYLSWGVGWGWKYATFFDFGLKNGTNRLYFVST